MQEKKNFQRRLIKLIETITSGFDLFLALALLISGLLLVYWATYDIFMVFVGETTLQKGILSMLGVFLIFYAVLELLRGEITRLNGGAFSLKAFVGLAMAAVIRKVLIASLAPEDIKLLQTLGFLLLCLGFVYWVIYKVEERPVQITQ